ncbi:MAG: kinase-like domain-containing protein [Piptocephalis tieghemiana]|nr:MAG: kinase-like domain-containing protein [Piptocephalis tieghemiana]
MFPTCPSRYQLCTSPYPTQPHHSSILHAQDSRTGVHVVLKACIPQGHWYDAPREESQTISREIEILRDLPPHAHVIDVYEALDQLLVFPLAIGDLGTWVRVRTREADASVALDVLVISLHILQALAFLHSQGILHRDIKPSNILLLPDGRTVISDLGKAIRMRSSHGAGVPFSFTPEQGTIAYQAPEMLLGATDYTEAVDLWSMGVTLYELLYARDPFHPDEDGSLAQISAIFRALGTPDPDLWPEYGVWMSCASLSMYPYPLQPLFHPSLNPSPLTKVISCLVHLRPSKRSSAQKVFHVL